MRRCVRWRSGAGSAGGEPDRGEVNYTHIFQHIDALGYTGPLGAEYRPAGATDDTLDWLHDAGAVIFIAKPDGALTYQMRSRPAAP